MEEAASAGTAPSHFLQDKRIQRKMAKVHHKMICSISEEQDHRAAAAGSPAEASATGMSQRPQHSAPQEEPWSPESIGVLLDVWGSPYILAMRESGKRHQVIYKTIARRLHKEGVRRRWRQCQEMMVALEDLYYTIQQANQRRQGEPIPCPFHEGLEKVLPFTYAWHEGPGHELPGAEHIDHESSGAYSWNPMPVWTAPWLGQLPPGMITWNGASIGEGENRATGQNSLHGPQQVILWTPSTFICSPDQMTNGNNPQGSPQEIPWMPLIILSNQFTPEHTFRQIPQFIPFHPTPLPYIQLQGTFQNIPHFQPWEIPSPVPVSALMENEEAGQSISQDRPQETPFSDAPLMNMVSEESVGNRYQEPTSLIPETVPGLGLIQNQEPADNNTQGHTA